jgi:murein DD-endopeptidase MepM/ murein hydrolase activator NlpD
LLQGCCAKRECTREVAMQKLLTLCLLSLAILLVAAPPALAGPPAQTGEEYVIQPGDTLFAIALRFGVTAADLAAANNLSNLDLIFVGQHLLIPGSGPLVEPAIVTESNATENAPLPALPPEVYVVQPGDTLFTIASRFGLTLTDVVVANGIRNPDYVYVGQKLVMPPTKAWAAEVSHPAPFASIELSPEPVLQGQTLVVRVTLSEPAAVSGEFDGRPIFFTGDDNGAWTLVGIHALQEVGIYSLPLRAKLKDGTEVATAVNVVVGPGPYATENIQVSPGRENLLEPELIQAEQERMVDLWSQFSPRRLWEGTFTPPIASSRITSPFGTRRSYNNGPVDAFHTGIDFGVGTDTPIYAPAAGRVVLAEELPVRGNAVLIDHGTGVFSGYWHQSDMAVRVGQAVQTGDLIGYVGNTGLVTGAHLHWEIRVGGFAVDPMQWTETAMP